MTEYKESELKEMSVEELSSIVFSLQEKLNSMEIHNEQLQQQYDSLIEQLNNAKRNRYGKKSEDVFNLQISLFDEAEYIVEKEIEEDITIKEHTRKKKKRIDLSKLPKERYDHDLDNKKCPTCGSNLTELQPLIKQVIRYEPGRYVLEEHYIHQYICKACSDDEKTVTYSGDNHQKLIDGSLLSPSLAAKIITDKYVQAIPLYRQEKEYNRRGIPIKRQNMSNWLLTIASEYIKSIYSIMEEDIMKEDILYGDETTVNCLQEKDRKKSYMWVRCNSPTSDKQIRLYNYSPSRGEEYCLELYKGYKGYLHCDGYKPYRKIPGVIVIGCWAHARRYLYDAICDSPSHKEYQKSYEKGKYLEEHPAYAKILELFTMVEELFSYEKDNKELSYEEIKEIRNTKSKEKLQAIHEWLQANKETFLPNSKSSKAIEYLINNWTYLNNYIKDGRLEITNNLAERTVKPFVIGRKNWLFANTTKGAKASAMLYSLIETAKANSIKPYEYIKYLLESMIGIDIDDKDKLKSLLPYSPTLPSNLKTPLK